MQFTALKGLGTENLTDLNNIPTPCPYLLIKYIVNCGVAERWVNRLFLKKIKN